MVVRAATMMDAPTTEPAAQAQPNVIEQLYLIGRPTLKQFLRFVKDNAVDVPHAGELVDAWNAARDVVRRLEREEAGLADQPAFQPLSPDNALLREWIMTPIVRQNFNTVPTEVAMVELDRLVVYQHHIDLTHVSKLKARLGPSPSDEELFHACLPVTAPETPIQVARSRRDEFVFMSPSNDIRFLGPTILRRDQLPADATRGNLASMIGLPVGFGSNFMNAIYAEKRLILNNGSHRAYALRALGITHAPCIVQHVSSRDELDVLASTAVTDAPDFYLQEPRPMMLKDYFDSRLVKIVPSHRRLRQITVKFDVRDTAVPAI